MAQVHKDKAKSKEVTKAETKVKDEQNAKLSEETADVLDEIDAVLGDLTDAEAEEMVKGFIQKGGELARHTREEEYDTLSV